MSDAVKDMIQNALDQDYNNANRAFGDVMTIKLNDLLDQEKIRLSDQIYNGVEEDDREIDPEEEQLEFDLEAEGELESEESGDEESDEIEDQDEDMSEEEYDELMAEVEDDDDEK